MSLYLKDSWISALRAGVRTHLRDVGRGWFNLQQSDWEVYQVSKLKKLIDMIKFNMQVQTIEKLCATDANSEHKCATRVSLIYRTEPTTKKCNTEKLKSNNNNNNNDDRLTAFDPGQPG